MGLLKKDKEIEIFQAQNLEINQRLLKIVEENKGLRKARSKLDTLCGLNSNQSDREVVGSAFFPKENSNNNNNNNNN